MTLVIENEDDMPDGMIDGISKEMLMWFVAKAGGEVVINLDDMDMQIAGKVLSFRATGSEEDKSITLGIEDIEQTVN